MSSSKAIRAKKGPNSWDAVSIHWANSDPNDFTPVTTLPQLTPVIDEKTGKVKSAILHHEVKILKKYQFTAGAPQLKGGAGQSKSYSHRAVLCDSVQQWIIVEVTTKEPLGADLGSWPEVLVWAFLQPPTIGHDKKRAERNHGYVVDDFPRAGWFEAVVMPGHRAMEVKTFPNGKNANPVTERQEVHVRKMSDKVVRYKLPVTVVNNESLDDLKKTAQRLRKKEQDPSHFEAGSYLKIWARNHRYAWSREPKDDDSERLVQDMKVDDGHINPAYVHSSPLFHRNHAWKRNRILAGTALVRPHKGESPDRNLLYVGLYPRPFIQKLQEVPKVVQPEKPEKINKLAWAIVTIAFLVLLLVIRKQRDAWATKLAGKTKAGEDPKRKATDRLIKLIKALHLEELFAAYAVSGIPDPETFKSVEKTKERAEKFPGDVFKSTKLFYERLVVIVMYLDAANAKQAKSVFDKEVKRWKAEMQKKERSGYKGDWKKDVFDWGREPGAESVQASLKFEYKGGKRLPPIPEPIPIPALSWLTWHTLLEISGTLQFKMSADLKDLKQNLIKLLLDVSANAQFKFEVGLRGIWAELADRASASGGEKSSDPLLKLVHDLVELVDLELVWSFLLELKDGGMAYSFQVNEGGKVDKVLDPTLCVKVKAPIRAQFSYWEVSYDIFNGTVMELSLEQGEFFKSINFMGNPITSWHQLVKWGDSPFETTCYLLPGKNSPKGGAKIATLGSVFELRLPYTKPTNEASKCTGSVGYVMGQLGHAQGGEAWTFAKDLPCRDEPQSGQGEIKGEAVCRAFLTWDATTSYKVSTPIRLTEIRKECQLEDLKPGGQNQLLNFFQELKRGKGAQLKPLLHRPGGAKTGIELEKESKLQLLWPQAQELRAELRNDGKVPAGYKGPAQYLRFDLQVDNYLDSWVWVQAFCQRVGPVPHGQGSGSTAVTAHETGILGPWYLARLLGTPALHGPRTLMIGAWDAQASLRLTPGYAYGVRLAVLDHPDCIFFESKTKLARV